MFAELASGGKGFLQQSVLYPVPSFVFSTLGLRVYPRPVRIGQLIYCLLWVLGVTEAEALLGFERIHYPCLLFIL